MYYGQKRGGKSGLIPFPRVGRGGENTWDLGDNTHKYEGDHIGEYCHIPAIYYWKNNNEQPEK